MIINLEFLSSRDSPNNSQEAPLKLKVKKKSPQVRFPWEREEIRGFIPFPRVSTTQNWRASHVEK